jgi:hypothetical protein
MSWEKIDLSCLTSCRQLSANEANIHMEVRPQIATTFFLTKNTYTTPHIVNLGYKFIKNSVSKFATEGAILSKLMSDGKGGYEFTVRV